MKMGFFTLKRGLLLTKIEKKNMYFFFHNISVCDEILKYVLIFSTNLPFYFQNIGKLWFFGWQTIMFDQKFQKYDFFDREKLSLSEE